jgi:hypothetical protein
MEATLTCPACRATHSAPMPEDACLWAYVCPRCGIEHHPLPGDCCVFCSYGDRVCPPRACEPR